MTRLTVWILLVFLGCVLANPHCPKRCFCDKHLTSVNCEGKSLAELPSDIPPQVERLYFRKNKISSIPPFAFAQFSRLNYIDLRQNLMTTVTRFSFSNCSKLQSLYLTANAIVEVDREAFTGTPLLSYLSLQANLLKKVPPLPGLLGLTSLVLEANHIHDVTFPDSYVNNLVLTDVVLSNNDVVSLNNKTFQSLRNAPVRKVEIARNHITTVESGTFSPLTAMTSLKIGYNPLDSLQLTNVIRGLSRTNFASLDIRNVSFAGRLPSETFALLRETQITGLIMSNNKIDTIPAGAFEDIPNLVQLDLSGCAIRTISGSAFTNLTDLQRLHLNDNDLSSVPQPLPPSLCYLYLKNNKIGKLADDTFIGLSGLQELNMMMNKIQELQKNAFRGLSQLLKLYLSGNKISSLSNTLFSFLPNLISLELDNNNIQSSNQCFEGLKSLVYLNMNNNPLSEMPLNVLQPMQSLQYLHLTNNRLGPLLASDTSGMLFSGLSKLKELHLSNNEIRVLPEPLLSEQKSLLVMNVSRNQISHWEKNLFISTRSLQTLDLSLNLVSLVNETSLNNLQSLKSLNLSGNPFVCSCDARWFCVWMNHTAIHLTSDEKYTCNLPPNWQGKTMSSFCAANIDCTNYLPFYIGGAVGGGFLLSALVFGVMYRYRWYVRYRFYKIGRGFRSLGTGAKNYEALPGDDRKYDIYISYADEDRSWVAEKILKLIDNRECIGIQNDGRYQVCFRDRDCEEGRSEMSSMNECIPASRFVVIIGTKNYATCRRCEFELDLVVDLQARKEIVDYRLVVAGALPANVPKPMERMLSRHRYVEWVDVKNAEKTFLERLTDNIDERRLVDEVHA